MEFENVILEKQLWFFTSSCMLLFLRKCTKSQNTDQGYTTKVNAEARIKREIAAASSQFIPLKYFNLLKEVISGYPVNKVKNPGHNLIILAPLYFV